MSVEGEDGETINVSASGDNEDSSMVIEGEDAETMTIGGGEGSRPAAWTRVRFDLRIGS